MRVLSLIKKNQAKTSNYLENIYIFFFFLQNKLKHNHPSPPYIFIIPKYAILLAMQF